MYSTTVKLLFTSDFLRMTLSLSYSCIYVLQVTRSVPCAFYGDPTPLLLHLWSFRVAVRTIDEDGIR